MVGLKLEKEQQKQAVLQKVTPRKEMTMNKIRYANNNNNNKIMEKTEAEA